MASCCSLSFRATALKSHLDGYFGNILIRLLLFIHMEKVTKFRDVTPVCLLHVGDRLCHPLPKNKISP